MPLIDTGVRSRRQLEAIAPFLPRRLRMGISADEAHHTCRDRNLRIPKGAVTNMRERAFDRTFPAWPALRHLCSRFAELHLTNRGRKTSGSSANRTRSGLHAQKAQTDIIAVMRILFPFVAESSD
jgi:hypothetical protein